MKVMGIVNVTPDSFSDGGKFFTSEEAVRRARNLVDDGADIIDLGGESTRPGATPIGWEEEWRRIEPVIEKLSDMTISVDTYHPETARLAIAAGAKIVNCVYAEFIPEMLKLLASNSVELVVPVKALEMVPECRSMLSRLYIDPMIGFGTTREEDLRLLKSISELSQQGRVLVGASRKRIVKKLTGGKVTGKNIGGNLAIAMWSAIKGASVVRVHDVLETVQALRVFAALED